MKTLVSALFFAGAIGLSAQPVSDRPATPPGERSALSVRSSQYPRISSDNRASFKIKAPEAKRVQIDLGKKYDMVRNAEGEWTCTTEPLGPGFHYYFLIIDGVPVADPASESFMGAAR